MEFVFIAFKVIFEGSKKFKLGLQKNARFGTNLSCHNIVAEPMRCSFIILCMRFECVTLLSPIFLFQTEKRPHPT